MNFFASDTYLDVLGDVYFPGRPRRVVDLDIDGHVIRVLQVNGRPVGNFQFLDYHLPLERSDHNSPARSRLYLRSVARDIIPIEGHEAGFAPDSIAPFIRWGAFGSFGEYWSSILSRPHMREYDRRRRKFTDRFGPLEFTPDDSRADVLPQAVAWKSAQLRRTGVRDYFAVADNVRFFEALRARGELVSATLRVSGSIVAVWLGAIHRGRFSGWIFAHTDNPEYKKYSVGHQLLRSLLEWSFASGHTEFDFSIGTDPYKLCYATHARVLGPVGRMPVAAMLKAHALTGGKLALRWSPRLYRFAKRTKARLLNGSRRPTPVPTATSAEPNGQGIGAASDGALELPGTSVQGLTEPVDTRTDRVEAVEMKIRERTAARAARNFAESDRLRAELDAMGVQVKDFKDPQTGEPVSTWEWK